MKNIIPLVFIIFSLTENVTAATSIDEILVGSWSVKADSSSGWNFSTKDKWITEVTFLADHSFKTEFLDVTPPHKLKKLESGSWSSNGDALILSYPMRKDPVSFKIGIISKDKTSYSSLYNGSGSFMRLPKKTEQGAAANP